jgi:hypothetical protein
MLTCDPFQHLDLPTANNGAHSHPARTGVTNIGQRELQATHPGCWARQLLGTLALCSCMEQRALLLARPAADGCMPVAQH